MWAVKVVDLSFRPLCDVDGSLIMLARRFSSSKRETWVRNSALSNFDLNYHKDKYCFLLGIRVF